MTALHVMMAAERVTTPEKLTGNGGGWLLAEVKHAASGQGTVISATAVERLSTFWDDANHFWVSVGFDGAEREYSHRLT